jgi:hypothetical protein
MLHSLEVESSRLFFSFFAQNNQFPVDGGHLKAGNWFFP